MYPADQVRIRITDALGSGLITLLVAAIVPALANSTVFSGNVFSSEAYLALLTLAALPLLLTLAGLAVAVFRDGPFGFFGFLFELSGTGTLITDPNGSALGAIVLGAVLVVVGSFIWSWTPVLKMLIRSRKRRAPPHGGFR